MSDKGAQNPISGQPMWESYADDVQRIAVPGGWLFRTCSWVELPTGPNDPNSGYDHWSDPVFVAEPETLAAQARSKAIIESVDCQDCGAAARCSCIVPFVTGPNVVTVDGRHFHRSRIKLSGWMS